VVSALEGLPPTAARPGPTVRPAVGPTNAAPPLLTLLTGDGAVPLPRAGTVLGPQPTSTASPAQRSYFAAIGRAPGPRPPAPPDTCATRDTPPGPIPASRPATPPSATEQTDRRQPLSIRWDRHVKHHPGQDRRRSPVSAELLVLRSSAVSDGRAARRLRAALAGRARRRVAN